MDRHEERIRRAVVAMDRLQRELDRSERAKSEPIAIVGMACRFPGGSGTPEEYWGLLANGRDAIGPVPGGRWDTEALYDPDPDSPGKTYLAAGGFLRDIDMFDADFFGISPREAECIDPQHRLLLEVAWEALEDAGIPGLGGRPAGVFSGICLNDYGSLQLNSADRSRITPYDGPGNAFCFASGRLSYFLDAHGPSLAVDTACSSSLVAIHLACLSLRSQESDIALAGAVQLHLSPQTSVFLSRSKALAPDGRCKPFDASADGFGRGEGCGVVVLKRLSSALADGDTIHAIIRGSAVNHDGRSSGLTVPNEAAQEALIRQALRQAKLEPAAIDYIEAHGTGTALGDPIEMAALAAVFGAGRDKPLVVGSVKSNFGHLEAASGMAGLLKVILALKNEQIPAHLHFRKPNPHIPWERIPIEIPAKAQAWPRTERPRMAGISSFGFSGTNAHLLIEEAPPPKPAVAEARDEECSLVISAKTEGALRELAMRYRGWLAGASESWAAICHSARVGRVRFEHALSVRNPSELDAFLEGRLSPFSDSNAPATPLYDGPRVKLPSYPFERRRFWVSAGAPATAVEGKRLHKAGREIVFESAIALGQPAFVGDHRIFGKPVMPLAGFVTMALGAAEQTLGTEKLELSAITVREPAILAGQGTHLFQTVLTPLDRGGYAFEISGENSAGGWTLHVTGNVAALAGSASARRPAEPLPVASVDHFYADFLERGIDYGPHYRLVESLQAGGSRSQARIGRGARLAVLDACFQSLAAAFPALAPGDTFLPVGIQRMRFERSFEGPIWCETEAGIREGTRLSGSLVVFDSNGGLLGEVEGFTSGLTASRREAPAYAPVWVPQPIAGRSKLFAEPVIFAPGPDAGAAELPSLCEDLLRLVRTLPGSARLCVVTQGAQAVAGERTNPWLAVLWGLGRTISNERPELRCRCIDLDPANPASRASDLQAELDAQDDEDQVSYRDGIRYVLRLVRSPLAPRSSETQRLTCSSPGTLDALGLVSTPRSRPGPGQVEIEVRAAGLNFKDVLHALGVVPATGAVPLGIECAGVVRAAGEGVSDLAPGDRVVSALSSGCFGHAVVADARFIAKLPVNLSFTEGAALPIAFMTARYALEHMVRLRPGTRVLIHAAAGGVGQAAVQIAQRAGAEIFATASRSKWDLLRSQGVTRVYDSRTIAFADEILRDTQGQGADIVLNSLKDDFRAAGLRALTPGGCFIELGLAGSSDPRCQLLQIGEVARREPSLIRSLLTSTIDGMAAGEWKPLQREEFPLERAGGAFRHMARAGHRGKIVITVPGVEAIRGAVLVTGGLGALGLQVAQWLASQGASHIILTGRSGSPGPVLPHIAARVSVIAADVSCEDSVASLFASLRDAGIDLRGVVHAAGVLRDGVLGGQSWRSLEEVFAPKVYGAWNLHCQTRHLNLDFFVCFSSFAALYGSPGQGAYAAANSFLDALMHHRRQMGLPGLSIGWGSWAGGGMAARGAQIHQGVQALAPERALAALGALLGTSHAHAAVVDADWQALTSRLDRVPSLLRSLVQPAALARPRELSLEERLLGVPAARRRSVLADFLSSEIASVLRLDPRQTIQERRGFFDYGLDSLMAVELRNRLQTAAGKPLPATLLFDAPNLRSLTDYFEATASPRAEEEDIEALLTRELALAVAEGHHG